MSRLRTLRTLSAAVLAILAGATLGAPNAAASGWPSPPAGVHVVSVWHTGFTVSLKRSANATRYHLYVSTVKSDLYYANLKSGHTSSALHRFNSRRPRITASGLTYRAIPYYYRVTASSSSGTSYQSTYPALGLRPDRPTSLQAVTNAQGDYLTWSSGRCSGFAIRRATDSAMTQNVRSVRISSQAHQYTPYGLTPGRTYYFQVRALNQSTPSAYTSPVAMRVTTREQSVLTMSYNILKLASDGTSEAGGVIPPWSQRRIAGAALIESVNPDVIGVQEGSGWVGSQPGTRQVDSLAQALRDSGADYRVAGTEVLWGQPGYSGRTGDYILYKPAVYRAYGGGGHWALSDTRWAAYQELQNVTTGAKFLVVSTHLPPGKGLTLDRERQRETERLLQLGGSLATHRGVPVVYVGDFNSSQLRTAHPLDGPAVAMQAAHVNNSRLVAQSLHAARYDSVNEYYRTPLAYFIHIDYLWAAPGMAVTLFGSALHLSDGRFVGTIPSDHNPVYARLVFRY